MVWEGRFGEDIFINDDSVIILTKSVTEVFVEQPVKILIPKGYPNCIIDFAEYGLFFSLLVELHRKGSEINGDTPCSFFPNKFVHQNRYLLV